MMKKTAINLKSLPAPQASFNRALEIDFGKYKLLIISGTASVGASRQTMYAGNFEAQARHTYKNIKDMLAGRKFEVSDVIKWKVYLKDIKRHYARFNKARDKFFKENKVSRKDMGASVCVQADLCRKDLFVEIEAVALKEK
ncbi:MAG: Rid family hydrolase [Candidatus Omnitrophota bacterium]|nr:Rid family hydrolase [Candidatus Omnitrophota bacterium]